MWQEEKENVSARQSCVIWGRIRSAVVLRARTREDFGEDEENTVRCCDGNAGRDKSEVAGDQLVQRFV